MSLLQCPLNSVESGKIVEVFRLMNTGFIRRRLLDIGCIEGTKIQCLQKSPSGDPVAYLIRGTVIALRSEDSKHILVQYQSD